uniref:Uncharacterized protein n=1 Tax=Corvus moneduloides TaxID=1196302 RepID=A0A8C3E7P9_CORMO
PRPRPLDMIQNLPVAIITALVLLLPFSACPGSGQTEPTCQPQLIQPTMRGCSAPPWSTQEGRLLPCPSLGPAPSAPTKMTPEACKHLSPQLSQVLGSCPATHQIWFSGSLCHHSRPPFPALSCLS